jgi:hypothetical protein
MVLISCSDSGRPRSSSSRSYDMSDLTLAEYIGLRWWCHKLLLVPLNNAGQSGHGSAKYSKAKEVVSCSLNKILKLCVMFMRLLCLRQCTCAGVVIAVADDEVPVVRRRRCVVYVWYICVVIVLVGIRSGVPMPGPMKKYVTSRQCYLL